MLKIKPSKISIFTSFAMDSGFRTNEELLDFINQITEGAPMNEPVVAVFDKKAGLFDKPFTCRHTAEAMREWATIKTMTDNKYGKNPEDYELFQLGAFNASTGEFINEPRQQLSSGV